MKRSLLSYVLVALVLVQVQSSMNSCSATRASPSKRNHNYIKESCGNTTYSRLCLKSLSKHANAINADPTLLAHTALNTTLLFTKYTSRMMKEMSQIHELKPKEVAAVLDCLADINDSVEELQKSMWGLDHVKEDSDFGLQINDIHTWINSALEDENTCLDAFARTDMNKKVKSKIRKRIVKLAQLTSNALALINNYALAKIKST